MKKLLAILFLFVSSIGLAQHQHDNYVTASGTDTYAVTISTPTIANYSTKRIHIRFANANTGASTINVTPTGASALGAVAIRAWDGDSWEALAGGEIDPEIDYLLIYSGVYFKLYNLNGGATGSSHSEVEIISGTTHTIDDDDNNKTFIYTNVSGCTVTLPNTVSEDPSVSFTAIKDTGAGDITFDDDGTSVLLTLSGSFVIEDEEGWASWKKTSATDWRGVGALGAATPATSGQGTTVTAGVVDLGGDVTTTRTFTGTGNWNWGSDATPYNGFLNFKGLYTGGTGGFSSVVRTNTTLYSQVLQYSDQLSLSARDATSGASNTSILFDGSANGLLQLKSNNRLLIQTNSNNYNISLDDDEGIGMKLGSDATGDTYYRNSSGFLQRLPVGTDGEVLKLVSGIPSWETDGGGGGGSGTVTDVTGTAPIVITGTSTVTPNVTINNAAADGSTKGAASFTAADFDASSGNIAIDYTNGTAASGSTKGFLTSADWTTFNGKQATGLSWLLASGGAQTADNTISGSFKTSFTTNSVGIGNSGTHAARLDVQGSGSTSSTFALMVGSATDPSILSVRDDGITYVGLGSSTLATSTYKTIFTSPWAYSTGSTRIQGIEGTSHYLGSAGVRIAAHTAGTIQSSTGNGIAIVTASDYIWFNFTNTGLGSSNRQNRFSGIQQATAGSVTGTLIEITSGVDNATTAQSNVTAIGIDYNPTNTGTITHYAALFRSGAVGIGTTTPTSRLETAASLGAAIASTSTDITLDETYYTVLVDASGAARTITLPAAAGCTRRIYVIKKTDSSGNSVTIDGNASETIDGATTSTLAAQWNTKVIQSNGTSWFITSSF
jgi:hypothetical protein